jgi:MoxR-like ATPase
MTGALQAVQQVLTTDQLLVMQQQVDQVYVDPSLIQYAVSVVAATRHPEHHGLGEFKRYIMFGASPRASINLILAARALALVRGRTYVLPQDVNDLTLDIIRHRLVLTYEALADNVSSEDIITRVSNAIPMPSVPLHEFSSSRSTI